MSRNANILAEANERVASKDYGHPLDVARTFAQLASAHPDLKEIKAEHYHWLMLCFKMARLSVSPFHRDSLIDLAGYARVAEMMVEKAVADAGDPRRMDGPESIQMDTAESVQQDAEVGDYAWGTMPKVPESYGGSE